MNSLFFSLLAWKMDAETGSTATASATTHSGSNGDFPEPSDLPRIGGVAQRDFVSAPASLNLQGRFGLFVSALKIPFPRNGDFGSKRRGSNAGSLSGEADRNRRLPRARVRAASMVNAARFR